MLLYQRHSSEPPAQGLVKQRAVQAELLQVAVRKPDVRWQRQALIYVLKHNNNKKQTNNKISVKTSLDLLQITPA